MTGDIAKVRHIAPQGAFNGIIRRDSREEVCVVVISRFISRFLSPRFEYEDAAMWLAREYDAWPSDYDVVTVFRLYVDGSMTIERPRAYPLDRYCIDFIGRDFWEALRREIGS